MFSHLFDSTINPAALDPDRLGRLFDLAMTKKLAVIKLPPSFLMADPKINPRADHLYWTALILGDTERAALAVSALAVEHEHGETGKTKTQRTSLAERPDRLTLALTERMDAADSALIGRIRTTATEVRP
jgi:hypothetical protein